MKKKRKIYKSIDEGRTGDLNDYISALNERSDQFWFTKVNNSPYNVAITDKNGNFIEQCQAVATYGYSGQIYHIHDFLEQNGGDPVLTMRYAYDAKNRRIKAIDKVDEFVRGEKEIWELITE